LAAPLLPTNPGTTWRYSMTEEVGKGLTISNLKQDADSKVRLPVLTTLMEWRTSTARGSQVRNARAGAVPIDLVTVDDHGITLVELTLMRN
jgi:hypothetical protein